MKLIDYLVKYVDDKDWPPQRPAAIVITVTTNNTPVKMICILSDNSLQEGILLNIANNIEISDDTSRVSRLDWMEKKAAYKRMHLPGDFFPSLRRPSVIVSFEDFSAPLKDYSGMIHPALSCAHNIKLNLVDFLAVIMNSAIEFKDWPPSGVAKFFADRSAIVITPTRGDCIKYSKLVIAVPSNLVFDAEDHVSLKDLEAKMLHLFKPVGMLSQSDQLARMAAWG